MAEIAQINQALDAEVPSAPGGPEALQLQSEKAARIYLELWGISSWCGQEGRQRIFSRPDGFFGGG
jgi:hypothetical protein